MKRVWVKLTPPGIGPQVLVHVSIYQGKPFWGYPIFDPKLVFETGFELEPTGCWASQASFFLLCFLHPSSCLPLVAVDPPAKS